MKKAQKIIINKSSLTIKESNEFVSVISFNTLKEWLKNGVFFQHIYRYQEADLVVYRLDVLSKPFLVALIIKLLANNASIIDHLEQKQSITFGYLYGLLKGLINDGLSISSLLTFILNEVTGLFSYNNNKRERWQINLSERPVYLRTDLWFDVSSGGSVGHIAGVLNNLEQFTSSPIFLSTDIIPTVRADIDTTIISEKTKYWDYKDIPDFASNSVFYASALKRLQNESLSFIYQRYSLNNYCGVKLANHFKVPFVLEYNGSEIWINRHWGTPLKYESLSEKIEYLNLQAADLIVVVSQPMKDELKGRNIDADKILVNPNGVEADRYSPHIKGNTIRKRYGLDDKLVIGFIGTFGPWHGTEVLVEAFGYLVNENPQLKERLRLLLIGDGSKMTVIKEIIASYGIEQLVVLTGTVPQEDGPKHLAACDILASPHVPNPDGTPFFGSPTKLFEYMAMAKGIVASDLDQIGEILEHQRTAWLVKPGDSDSLKAGLQMLIDNPGLRETLGRAAREEVIQHYTWQEHTRKIIEKLKERCA